MTSAETVQTALNRLARLALKATGADRCAIFVHEPTGGLTLVPTAGDTRLGDPEQIRQKFQDMQPIDITADPLHLDLWRSPRTVTLDEAKESPLIPADWKKQWGSKSLALSFLRAGGHLYGVIAVDYVRRPHRFTTAEADLLDAIAGAAGAAMRNARLMELVHHGLEVQRRLNQTLELRFRLNEALRRLSDLVVGTAKLRPLVSQLNQTVCKEAGLECLGLTFTDSETTDLFKLPAPTETEIEILGGWRRLERNQRYQHNRKPLSENKGEKLAVAIPMGAKVAGILWVRVSEIVEEETVDLLHTIAAGLGEIAQKAKLRKTLESRSRELAVASERERIAQDLHDTVGQTLYGIGLRIEDALCEAEHNPELRKRLEELRAMAAQGVSDTRSAVYALSFLQVRARGFVPSLRELTKQFRSTTGVHAELRTEGPTRRLPEDITGALYRVAHEALVNVDRHARASGVVISLINHDHAVELSICDDGVGLNNRQAADWRSGAHFGLRAMAKSIEEVGGKFQATRATPRGLIVRCIVPIGGRRK